MTDEPVVTHINPTVHSDYSLQFNRWSLKPIGAWPSTLSTSKHERIISVALIVICFSLILFSIIPCWLHVFLEDESFYIKVKVIGPLAHWMLGAIIYITLLLRRNDIRHCVNHIETDWKMVTRKKDEKVMLRNAKFGRYVAIFCAIFVQGGIMAYCLITASNTQIMEIGNETRILHTLPLATYEKLIPVDKNPVNEIVILSQFLSGFIVNTSEVGIFSLAAVLAAHACGQLDVLMVWIDDFVKEARNGGKDALFREIAIIVEHHLRVLE
ncbi:hypothetical protein ANTQUA_LOCUS4044 [Anthophora quadrimaculata]